MDGRTTTITMFFNVVLFDIIYVLGAWRHPPFTAEAYQARKPVGSDPSPPSQRRQEGVQKTKQTLMLEKK